MTLQAYKIRPDLDTKLPEYGSEYSACFDIFASFDDTDIIEGFTVDNIPFQVNVSCGEFLILSGERLKVPTNLIFKIPEGYSMRAHPKSGLSLKYGISLFNSEGIIDRDYPEQSFITLVNNSKSRFTIKNNMKLCQAELVPIVKTMFSWDYTPELDLTSTRTSGFGSTSLF